MERKDKKRNQAATHPAKSPGLDTKEAGPSRLFAPGKPREVEAGPSRLGTATLQRQKTGIAPRSASAGPQIEGGLDTTEAGGPRIARYQKQQ